MILSLLLVSTLSKQSTANYFYNHQRPLIISHRGACGYIPQHSLQSYQVAGYMGSDFIQPDIVLTSDGQMIINHDIILDSTTNIKDFPVYTSKQTIKTIPTYIGNSTLKGYFVSDFKYQEIKQVKLNQRLLQRPQSMNGLFKIQKLEEVLDWLLVQNQTRSAKNQTLLGAYIELKQPEFHSNLGFDMPSLLIQLLAKKGVQNIQAAAKKCPIIIQCFQIQPLKALGKLTDLPLVFLMHFGALQYDLKTIAQIVHGIGVDFPFVFDGKYSKGFVREVHALNLAVHVWNVKNDDLPVGETPKTFYLRIKNQKIDGVFTEFPDIAFEYFNLLNQIKIKLVSSYRGVRGLEISFPQKRLVLLFQNSRHAKRFWKR